MYIQATIERCFNAYVHVLLLLSGFSQRLSGGATRIQPPQFLSFSRVSLEDGSDGGRLPAPCTPALDFPMFRFPCAIAGYESQGLEKNTVAFLAVWCWGIDLENIWLLLERKISRGRVEVLYELFGVPCWLLPRCRDQRGGL